MAIGVDEEPDKECLKKIGEVPAVEEFVFLKLEAYKQFLFNVSIDSWDQPGRQRRRWSVRGNPDASGGGTRDTRVSSRMSMVPEIRRWEEMRMPKNRQPQCFLMCKIQISPEKRQPRISRRFSSFSFGKCK
ncbi:hypothetical protein QJS10_CPB18g00254 [Acorus calamus]|uniref:Uncharacterized protein n=1 Tax=Acorus calamus TaxID=4465 RepID=A0AAV9CNB4_ACOCL|nr:hypothetical protein QJS10_CPB18g00254 [Acorus calamus]